MEPAQCQLGEGFTGWVAQHGEPILVNDANHDPRGATIAGTEDIDESMLVVPMRYDGATIGVITLSKLGLDGFGSDDLRLLTILADRAATAIGSVRLLTRAQDLALELRRLLDMSGELSGSLDPHQVADLMAGHLARAMGVGECIISYWDRAAGRVESLGYYPAHRIRTSSPSTRSPASPRPCACSSEQIEVIVDVDDPVADPPRSSSCAGTATGSWPCCRWWPRASRSASSSCLQRSGRRSTTSAWPRPDDGQRGGHGARERPAVRGRPEPGRPRPADRLLQPPLPPRAPRRGGHPRAARRGGR